MIFIPLLLSAFAFGAEIIVSAAGVLNLLPAALESSLHLGLALLIFGLQLLAVSAAFQLKIPGPFAFPIPICAAKFDYPIGCFCAADQRHVGLCDGGNGLL